MAILEVTITGEMLGVTMINRWNYYTQSTPAAVSRSFALASALGAIPELGVYPPETFLQYMRAMQTDEFVYQSIYIFSVYNPEDFYETAFVPELRGARTDASGGATSPVLSAGFRTSRTRRDIRRGFKRVGGIDKVFLADGGVLNAAGTQALQDFAGKMTETMTYDDEGNSLEFNGCVISKEKYVDDGKEKRRYYLTEPEQVLHMATGFQWQPYGDVRTQTTRQYGRGI